MELETVFDAFADEAEAQLARMAERLQAMEIRSAELESRMAELQTRAAEPVVVPPAVLGKDGEDGKDGRGIAGAHLREGNLIIRFTDGSEQDVGRVAADPVVVPDPKDGEDGDDGKDGRGIAGVEVREGSLVVRLTDGTEQQAGRVVGKDGQDGIATLEELDARIEARFAELQVRTLADSWRGVWTPDDLYQRGNVAQWDGSPWLALAENPTTKPGTSKEWVLFAKKGRDGKR